MSKWKKRIATGVLLLTMALAAVGKILRKEIYGYAECSV